MDHELQRQPSLSRSLLSRTLTRRAAASDSLEDVKGPLGLNTLHTPRWGSVSADLIFVHGLGGGSRSTWTKSGDSSLYWPKEWLPNDDSFQDIRIHSFGYDSNWDKESILGIHDFANALLGCILNCPRIPRKSRAIFRVACSFVTLHAAENCAQVHKLNMECVAHQVGIYIPICRAYGFFLSQTPIILLGHSMGGLVIKRAYLLAKGKKEYMTLATRVQAIFFLATPHRGSDLAQTLSRLLNLSGGPRPFVADLHRDSLAIQSINDEFPQYCQEIQLYSFYETIFTNFGVKKALVVERESATLGYPNERREYLHANHREVCKYASQDDPNYQTVRNALASVLDVLRDRSMSLKRSISNDHRRSLDTLLGTSDAPEDDFISADSLRMSGSGKWLISKTNFQDWLQCTSSTIYCIIAKPATGKTILSGKVIAYLRKLRKNCSFYFFKYGNKEKSSIASFLLSIAWQMAHSNEQVLAICLEIYEKEDQLSKADYRTVWRKLFVEGIFKVTFEGNYYWVIDALDECKNESDLVPLLMKLAEISPVRIFLTSRNRFESRQRLGLSKAQVLSEPILEENSKSDITLYLDANVDELPSVDDNGRQHIVDQIVEKSRGCFLWVSLVFQELRNARTSTDVRKILDEVPTDMNDLFARILDSMSAASYGKPLAKAILTWTICATRPLKTLELHAALQLDLDDSIDSVEASIRSCCGQLVYVDAKRQVQMIHLTAQDFLLQTSTESEFVVNKVEGHRRILLICLKYLNGNEMRGPTRRKSSASSIPKERSALVDYACNSMFEHVVHVSWTDNEVLHSLAAFFSSSNVLSWIEYIAKHSDLNRLIHTGKALGKFLQGVSDQHSPSIALLCSWSTDLVRLVMKFGKNMEAYPSWMLDLISPFCPPKTAPWKQFGSAARSITVRGLRAETWDECLATIVDTQEQHSSLASSKTKFAIGSFSGKIVLFKQATCQEIATLQHEEPVRLLKFGEEENILVSAGSKTIRVWELTSRDQLRSFDAPQQCMSIGLTDHDQFLLAAMKDHRLKIWDLNDGILTNDVNWTRGLEEMTTRLYRRPITAAFGVDAGLLAIIYKGQDILLWDLESDCLYDIYSREAGGSGVAGRPYGSAGVRCLVFGSGVNANLLACAYGDGELVLFDTSTGEVKKRIVAFAHLIACSADGSTLATADPSGTIQLFDFQTMHLLYRIKSVEPGIQGLAFGGDDRRLLDIRGSRCRIWGPTVLVGQGVSEASRGTAPLSSAPQEVSLQPFEDVVLITSVACHDSGDVFFCGKENGSVYLYDVESGLPSQTLFSHAHGVAIVSLYFEEKSHTISSIDSSSRIMIHRLSHHTPSMTVSELLFDHRADMAVEQLVCQPGLNRVLVCSASSDMLWSISLYGSALIATITYQNRDRYRWANHPSKPGRLILITNNVAHLYEWVTLQRLTSPAGILLEGSILPELSICSITPCFNGTVLATMFSESERPHSKSRLLLWATSEFALESKTIAPVPAYRALSEKVELLIGTTGTGSEQTERLVFLHGSDWVCAADAHTAKSNHFMRHFFSPADWLSTNLDLIIEVTKKGDVILVKRDEVAVVRKGLLTSVNLDEGALISGGKRPSFARGVRRPSTLMPPEP